MKLEVGNVVYCFRGENIVSKYVIDRTTKTQAIARSGTVFHREYSDGHVRDKRSDLYSPYHYNIATPELDKEWEFMKALRRMEKAWEALDQSNLTIEQVETITETLNAHRT